MKRQTQRARRHALYGWVKWIPVLALIFSVLLFDAWLNIQKRQSDYILNALNTERRTLDMESDKVDAQAALNRNLNDLAKVQEELGMQAPAPGQIETIEYIAGTWDTLYTHTEFTLAQALEPAIAIPVNDLSVIPYTEEVALDDVQQAFGLADPEPEMVEVALPIQDYRAEEPRIESPILNDMDPEEIILDGLTIIKSEEPDTIPVTLQPLPPTPQATVMLQTENMDASIDQLLD